MSDYQWYWDLASLRLFAHKAHPSTVPFVRGGKGSLSPVHWLDERRTKPRGRGSIDVSTVRNNSRQIYHSTLESKFLFVRLVANLICVLRKLKRKRREWCSILLCVHIQSELRHSGYTAVGEYSLASRWAVLGESDIAVLV